ncbi:Uncharacterised protein [Escherichia coli]|uniref:Uncharacterized protein n=1 Tax=Escherichia coli TaxID=562 RepID=A0A376Y431_ECOLX|nr:Uncharacterised protein [Escherichia coli]
MPDSTYQALSSLLFVFLESHHKIDKSQAAKKRRLNAFFLLATNPRKKLTVSANTLILIAFYGANNV